MHLWDCFLTSTSVFHLLSSCIMCQYSIWCWWNLTQVWSSTSQQKKNIEMVLKINLLQYSVRALNFKLSKPSCFLSYGPFVNIIANPNHGKVLLLWPQFLYKKWISSDCSKVRTISACFDFDWVTTQRSGSVVLWHVVWSGWQTSGRSGRAWVNITAKYLQLLVTWSECIIYSYPSNVFVSFYTRMTQ